MSAPLPSGPSNGYRTHQDHHFIPAAFLEKWHTPHEKPHLDDRLVAFTVKAGRLVWKRYKSKSVASQVGLYATPLRGPELANGFEQNELQRIDNDAARVHHDLLEGDGSSITPHAWEAWNRFLTTLLIRLPDEVETYRAQGFAILRARIETDAVISEMERAKLMARLEADPDGLAREVSIASYTNFVPDNRVLRKLRDSEWCIRSVPHAAVDLIVSDAPMIRSPGPMDGPYFFALPISPRMLFFAHDHHPEVEMFAKMSDDDLVRHANECSGFQARRSIFATGDHHEALARRYLLGGAAAT